MHNHPRQATAWATPKSTDNLFYASAAIVGKAEAEPVHPVVDTNFTQPATADGQ